VTVDILEKVYRTGRRYAEGFKKDMKIVFDDILPRWNYRAVPSPVMISGSYRIGDPKVYPARSYSTGDLYPSDE
jgi:hypothetical protein